MLRIVIALVAIGFIAVSTAIGQSRANRRLDPVPSTTGLSIGVHSILIGGVSLEGPDIDGAFNSNLGGGAGIEIGYGFNSRLTAFVSADLAHQSSNVDYLDGSMGLTHLEVGARLSFPQPHKRWVPYLTALVGKRALRTSGVEDERHFSLALSGTEIGAGGGILYALMPGFSLDAGLLAGTGKFGRAAYRGEVVDDLTLDVHNTTTVRLKIGFQWSPSRRPGTS